MQSIYQTLQLLKVPNIKIQEKSQIAFCKTLKNKWCHAKILLKMFYLNGHTVGLRLQTKKLKLHDLSPSLTLGVTGVKLCSEMHIRAEGW